MPPEFFAFKAEFEAKGATIEEAQRNGYHSWVGSSYSPAAPAVCQRQRG